MYPSKQVRARMVALAAAGLMTAVFPAIGFAQETGDGGVPSGVVANPAIEFVTSPVQAQEPVSVAGVAVRPQGQQEVQLPRTGGVGPAQGLTLEQGLALSVGFLLAAAGTGMLLVKRVAFLSWIRLRSTDLR